MANPLASLAPALKVLAEKLSILPAVGGAVEDLQRPDPEELEDSQINRAVREITTFAETPEPSPAALYRPTPPLFRAENHLYRYFIDGSLRTYYLATGIEGNRSFPIELAQIGAAVIQRDPEGNVRPLCVRNKILLLVPKGQRGVSDTVWQELQKLNASAGDLFEVVDVVEGDVVSGEDSTDHPVDLRNKSGGKARHRMHVLEIELINTTDDLRSSQSWLILDGSVKLDQFIKERYIIGVAKSFSKDPQFHLGKGRPSLRKNITAILAGLPYAHRTAAFLAHDGNVAFWYVRLREQKELDYPLMGVVKVELPLLDGKPVEAEMADLLSRALVAERNVAPYGKDTRWHCHLYPIYLAEQTIKNRFYSREALMGTIRWPQATQT